VLDYTYSGYCGLKSRERRGVKLTLSFNSREGNDVVTECFGEIMWTDKNFQRFMSFVALSRMYISSLFQIPYIDSLILLQGAWVAFMWELSNFTDDFDHWITSGILSSR
jgi:hypothetical protein